MSWARVGIFLMEAYLERRRLNSAAETLGLKVFDFEALRALGALKPDATTAFILATGASAADLNDQRLEYIQSQFSIGVNQWILHPMIPDVYSYEVDPDVRLLQALDRPAVKEKLPYLLFLKPSRHADFLNASHLPEFMAENCRLYSRRNIWTRSRQNIYRDFRRISGALGLLRKPDVLLDNGASIARLITLCALMGFRRIVLVGVDLNSVEYFWHRKPELIRHLGFSEFGTNQQGATHETLTSSNRPFPIDEYVIEVCGNNQSSIRVLVESPNSLLAGNVDVWNHEPSC